MPSYVDVACAWRKEIRRETIVGHSELEGLLRDAVRMAEPASCGAALTERLGELADAMARVLELHPEAIDVDNGEARMELRAYAKLAHAFRALATELKTIATDMHDRPTCRSAGTSTT
jgi:hypothetical protein